tara:strand:+ start:3650 stop:4507 length:858 start_codon:yes stop_codon:yes gene_type:complete
MNLSSASSLLNAGAEQDFVATHDMVDLGVIWAVCCDGHGETARGGFALNTWIGEYDWTDLFRRAEVTEGHIPGQLLEWDLGNAVSETIGEGVCVLLCRVDCDSIQFWTLGDVVGKIYENGTLVSSTVPHSSHSLVKESYNDRITSDWQVKVIDEDRITMTRSARLQLNPNYGKHKIDPINSHASDKCAVYACLGHRGWAARDWSYLRRDITVIDVSIVIGSDGLWDMLSPSEIEILPQLDRFTAEGLARNAQRRWNKEWEYMWQGKSVGRQKIDSADDVSCIVIN